MSFRLLCSLILPGLFLPLAAQGIYLNANSPTDVICPLMDVDKSSLNYGARGTGTTGGMAGADSGATRYYQQGSQFFPQGQRKPVTAFAAYDAQGKGTSIASLKGKVVLVGLWSVRCDPSAKMLMELASLYPKREQFGFEILAVNFDENKLESDIKGGWRAINSFMSRNRQFFEVSKMPVYTPGVGKEGGGNFMETIYSLPTLFVIDRQGNLAQLHIGYKGGFVGEAIQRAIRERPTAPVIPATESQPVQSAQP